MSQSIKDKQIPPPNFNHPVVPLIGKTGSGKSTLGNLLLDKPHDEGTFVVSAGMESCTQECNTSELIIDEVHYELVDTPGIFDSRISELERNQSCFALDTKVQLSSGKVVEMAELQVGDLVSSNVRNNKLEFSEVYLISHLGHHDYPLKMIKIEFTNPDGSKGQIRMTSTHCIFRSDLSILYAQDIVPGETKILVLDKANELIPVIVDSLVIERDTGYISFYTRSGTVIANNTLCSCYDDCPRSQLLMDLAFAPIQLWTKVVPSTHRQKELHPYVKILETAYVTWCKALDAFKGIKLI